MIIMMWHPIGSQVACKVVFRPMPSGGVCKVSGDPLRVPTKGPIKCKSFRVTCKRVLCVCLGKCMVVTPLHMSPYQPPSPVQCRHSCLRPTQCDLTVLHMPSPSASCLSSKRIFRVCSWTSAVCTMCPSFLGILGLGSHSSEGLMGGSWLFRVLGFISGLLVFTLDCFLSSLDLLFNYEAL